MRLSKRTEYGVRAIIQLARRWPHSFVQSRDLAEEEGKLPKKFLEAILLALRRGGFVESKIGREGGYRLARPPRDINVGELVRRLEGRLTIKDDKLKDEVPPGEVAVHLLNTRLTEATEKALDQLTLEQLLEQTSRAGGVNQQMYYI